MEFTPQVVLLNYLDITSVGSGAIISDEERSKLNNIEAGADVTDFDNVSAAGAFMMLI